MRLNTLFVAFGLIVYGALRERNRMEGQGELGELCMHSSPSVAQGGAGVEHKKPWRCAASESLPQKDIYGYHEISQDIPRYPYIRICMDIF